MSRPHASNSSGSNAGALPILFGAVAISLSNVLIPPIYEAGNNAGTLLVLRYSAFTATCLLWLAFAGTPFTLTWRDRLHGLGTGLAYAAGAGALLTSFAFLQVSTAILIFFTFPLITRLLESILDRALPSWLEMACLAGALCGLAVLVGAPERSPDPIGVGIALLAAVCIGSSFVWSARALHHLPVNTMTLMLALVGLAGSGLLVTVTGSWQLSVPDRNVGLLLAAVVTCFSVAFLCMFVSIRFIGASRTAAFLNLEPVFTVILAFILLGETLLGTQMAGGVLVVASIIGAHYASGLSPAHQRS